MSVDVKGRGEDRGAVGPSSPRRGAGEGVLVPVVSAWSESVPVHVLSVYGL